MYTYVSHYIAKCVWHCYITVARAIFIFQCAQGQQINCAPLNFSISTCINFHLKNQKKKRKTCNVLMMYYFNQLWTYDVSLLSKTFCKNLFSTNFAPPKAVATQSHSLIGLRHKVALTVALDCFRTQYFSSNYFNLVLHIIVAFVCYFFITVTI